MNAVQTATVAPIPATAATTPARLPMVGMLRALLLAEAVLGLGLAIFLSMLAAGMRDFVGGDAGLAAEETIRFAAGGAFVFAIFAAVASRGARRRRGWAWTLAALLQVVAAIGTGVAIMTATWHPALLIGFGAAAAVMLVLSTPSVRSALGQE
ncbi:hypothetical protein BH23CHL9_BH23CHL9_06130 [soil metagenome]